MALGVSVQNKKANKSGDTPLRAIDVSIPLDNSYPANGYTGFQAYARAQASLGKENITVLGVINVGGLSTHYAEYDAANDRLKVFVRTTGVEVAGAVDLAAITLRLVVFGY